MSNIGDPHVLQKRTHESTTCELSAFVRVCAASRRAAMATLGELPIPQIKKLLRMCDIEAVHILAAKTKIELLELAASHGIVNVPDEWTLEMIRQEQARRQAIALAKLTVAGLAHEREMAEQAGVLAPSVVEVFGGDISPNATQRMPSKRGVARKRGTAGAKQSKAAAGHSGGGQHSAPAGSTSGSSPRQQRSASASPPRKNGRGSNKSGSRDGAATAAGAINDEPEIDFGGEVIVAHAADAPPAAGGHSPSASAKASKVSGTKASRQYLSLQRPPAAAATAAAVLHAAPDASFAFNAASASIAPAAPMPRVSATAQPVPTAPSPPTPLNPPHLRHPWQAEQEPSHEQRRPAVSQLASVASADEPRCSSTTAAQPTLAHDARAHRAQTSQVPAQTRTARQMDARPSDARPRLNSPPTGSRQPVRKEPRGNTSPEDERIIDDDAGERAELSSVIHAHALPSLAELRDALASGRNRPDVTPKNARKGVRSVRMGANVPDVNASADAQPITQLESAMFSSL